MLFTLLQYLPFAEEDHLGSNTELLKNENKSNNSDDSDEDGCDDELTAIHTVLSLSLTYSAGASAAMYSDEHLPDCRYYQIHTPPPKI